MAILRSLVGIATTLPLVFGSALAPATSSAPPPEAGAEAVEGLVDSAELDGPVIAEGVLSSTDDTAPEDSLVILYAWPSGEDLSRVEVGETVKTVPLAYARTDADGAFELKLSDVDEALVDQYRNADGDIDFEVMGVDSERVYTDHFTADNPETAPAAKVAVSKSRVSQPKPHRLNVRVVPGLKPRFDTSLMGRDRIPVNKVCETTKVANLGNVWTSVGYGYVSGSGATMKFSYKSGASSTLGVGVSVSGGAGSYRMSGTSTFSSTAEVGYPETAGYKEWRTQFRYGKYKRNVCPYVKEVYVAKVDGYAGGATIKSLSSHPAANYCVTQQAGTTFNKSTTASYSSTNGVSIKGILGVDLSAKTGYSSTAKLTFTFSKTKRLCGTHDNPGGDPVRLVAR